MARESNEVFMSRVLNYGCPTGPLVHGFVFEALRKYCESVVATPATRFDSAFLSGESWVATGQWLGEQIGKHLNTPFPEPEAKPGSITTTYSGFVTIEGVRTQVDFQAPSGARKEELDSAFLDALAQVATLDYGAIGSEPAQS